MSIKGITGVRCIKCVKRVKCSNLLENLNACWKYSRKDSIYAKYLYDDWRCVENLWHIKTNDLIL